MANSPTTIRVANEDLARQIAEAGKRLIELSMAVQDGFDVPVKYTKAEETN